jgi:hypothetical protein
MNQLDRLIADARGNDSNWTLERQNRVLSTTLRRHEERVARARFARRAIGVASATAIIVVFFLRGTSSSASTHIDTPSVAELASNDAGYARD